MKQLKRVFRHFKTITQHRHMVMKHCIKAGIPFQGLLHDLSKYTPQEFLTGVTYYTDGTKSPNEAERQIEGYSKAWLHHKGRNRHHFEYWNDYNPKVGKVMPVPMPTRFLKELICDRIAASKIYQGNNYTKEHPLSYFLKGKPNRFIAPETSDLIEHFLTVLAKDGEETMFEELRKL